MAWQIMPVPREKFIFFAFKKHAEIIIIKKRKVKISVTPNNFLSPFFMFLISPLA